MDERAIDEAAVPCERCGYDVRAQPTNGRCPECGASVARSREVAKIPRRPAWAASDPRWRRRMLAGIWLLTLMPAVAFVRAFGWAESVPMPTFWQVQGMMTLRDSYVPMVYAYLMFCTGVALLFSRERGRRAGPFDWTRRWGAVASSLVLFFGAIPYLFVTALVLAGISALLLSIPLRYQPGATDAMAHAGWLLLRYGPHPVAVLDVALPASAAIVMLLACAPLCDALRSVGRRPWWALLTVPLAVAAMRQLILIALSRLNVLPRSWDAVPIHLFEFFDVAGLAEGIATLGDRSMGRELVYETAKWLACAAIAVRLTITQLASKWAFRSRPPIQTRDSQ